MSPRGPLWTEGFQSGRRTPPDQAKTERNERKRNRNRTEKKRKKNCCKKLTQSELETEKTKRAKEKLNRNETRHATGPKENYLNEKENEKNYTLKK